MLGAQLEEWLRKTSLSLAVLNTTPVDPSTVQAGVPADVGTLTGHAPSTDDHVHHVETAIPSHATGSAAAEGTGTALMRADATILQGIVQVKGDLLGFSNVPVRLPVGADGHLIVADAASAAGLKWETPVTIFDVAAADGSTGFLTLTGTLPDPTIGDVSGAYFNITTAGATSVASNLGPIGVVVRLQAGYTGTSRAIAFEVGHGVAGTSVPPAGAGGKDLLGNIGILGASYSAGAGTNIAVVGYGQNVGTGDAIGGLFESRFNTGGGKAIGVIGVGGNPGSQVSIGAVFGLGSSEAPKTSESAVIVGDSCHGGFNVPLLILNSVGVRSFSVELGGGIRVKGASLGSVTLDNTNHVIRVDTSGGPVTITLPAIAAGNRGIWYRFKNEGANALTIATTGADTIDLAPTKVLPNQFDSTDIVCPEAGTDWLTLGASTASVAGADDEARAMAFMAA